MSMKDLTIKEIGRRLAQAGRLETRTLCTYGSDAVPENSIPIKKINRCLANAIFSLSLKIYRSLFCRTLIL